VPEALQKQLGISGRMIIPVGSTFQELVIITRGKGDIWKNDYSSRIYFPRVSSYYQRQEKI